MVNINHGTIYSHFEMQFCKEPEYLGQYSDYAMGWTTGIRAPAGADIPNFTTASKPALVSTQGGYRFELRR
jgi:hypothetical protein